MLDTEFSKEFQIPIEIAKVSRINVEYLNKNYRYLKLTEEGKIEVLMYTTFISLMILKPKLRNQEWEQLSHDFLVYLFSKIKKLKPHFDDDQIETLLETRFINLPSEIMVLSEKIALNIGLQRYFFFYIKPLIQQNDILELKNPSGVMYSKFKEVLNDITNFTFQSIHQLDTVSGTNEALSYKNDNIVNSSSKEILNNLSSINLSNNKSTDSENKKEKFINSDNIPHSNSARQKTPSQKIVKPKRFRVLKVFILLIILLSAAGYFFKDQILASFDLISNNEEKNIEDEWQKYSWLNHRSKVFLFQNGDTIKEVFTKKEWDALCKQKTPAYCHVENNAENDEKYGLLYNWWAINDSRNICPEGFRLANENDFLVLSKDSVFNQNANQIINHFPGYKNENGYFIGKDKLLTVWFNKARYKGCYEAFIISENRIKQDCYASTHAYSISLIPE